MIFGCVRTIFGCVRRNWVFFGVKWVLDTDKMSGF